VVTKVQKAKEKRRKCTQTTSLKTWVAMCSGSSNMALAYNLPMQYIQNIHPCPSYVSLKQAKHETVMILLGVCYDKLCLI
jgi:hypothetical protein